MTDVKLVLVFAVLLFFVAAVAHDEIKSVARLEARIQALEQALSAHPEAVKPATPVRANDKGGK